MKLVNWGAVIAIIANFIAWDMLYHAFMHLHRAKLLPWQ